MKVGSDEVQVDGERVVIYAANAMDWPIREFCRVPIWFRNRRYFLRSMHRDERSRRIVYELSPWPLEFTAASNQEVVYDEAYVADRDQAARGAQRSNWVYLVLLPLYPALGLLWSGSKNRTLSAIGFEGRSITKASIALTFNLFLLQGVFAGWLAGGILTYFTGQPLRVLDYALLLLLGADSAMRFGQSMQFDVERHWGFCEWLWPGRRQ